MSNEVLNEYKRIVLGDQNTYGKEANLIGKILRRLPENVDPEIVALKVSLIDMTNTTQLSRAKSYLSLNDITDIICNTRDIDNRLEAGDITLVSEMSKECQDKFGYNPFSFMSKYCTYHNVEVYRKDDFSIFDTVLKNNIPKYVKGLKASTIDGWRKKCDYASYWNCIDGLLKEFQLTIDNKRRAFDYCIWYYYRPEKENNKTDD